MKITVPHGGAGALIYYQGESEPLTNRFLRSFLVPGMVVWDVGAHIGEHTLLAAHAVGLTGEIHAFEPNPDISSLLTSNVRLNGMENVVVNQLAVSNALKKTTFEVFDEPAISCLTPDRGSDARRSAIRQIHVSCTSLDEYGRGKRLPNLIKIDVEGAELSVLEGMISLLSLETALAPTLILEFCRSNTERFGYQPKRLVAMLNKYGFMVYCLSKNGLIPFNSETDNDQSSENNLIASKKEPCVHLV